MQVEIKKDEIETNTQNNYIKVELELSSIKKKQIDAACDGLAKYVAAYSKNLTKEILPNQVAVHPTLKTPCGQGTKTWSRYKLIVHQRRFTFSAVHENLENIIQFLKNFPHVNIKMGIQD